MRTPVRLSSCAKASFWAGGKSSVGLLPPRLSRSVSMLVRTLYSRVVCACVTCGLVRNTKNSATPITASVSRIIKIYEASSRVRKPPNMTSIRIYSALSAQLYTGPPDFGVIGGVGTSKEIVQSRYAICVPGPRQKKRPIQRAEKIYLEENIVC